MNTFQWGWWVNCVSLKWQTGDCECKIETEVEESGGEKVKGKFHSRIRRESPEWE